jgi:predicted amidophosphoribosyltransferase
VGAPPTLLSQPLVPIPPDPLRGLMRGFDPAEEIAARLAQRHGRSASYCLARARGRRQVGRRRSERLSRPPRVRAVADVPARVTLVDDVVTTGATLSGCAQALRAAGAVRVDAIAFARAL